MLDIKGGNSPSPYLTLLSCRKLKSVSAVELHLLFLLSVHAAVLLRGSALFASPPPSTRSPQTSGQRERGGGEREREREKERLIDGPLAKERDKERQRATQRLGFMGLN